MHPRRLLHPEQGSENSRLNQNGWTALATRTVAGLQNAIAFMLGAAFAACKAVARRFGGIMTALTGICCAAYGLQLTAALTTMVVVGMQGVTTIIHLLMGETMPELPSKQRRHLPPPEPTRLEDHPNQGHTPKATSNRQTAKN